MCQLHARIINPYPIPRNLAERALTKPPRLLCAQFAWHPKQNEDEVKKLVTVMQNPRQYRIPDWFLNRQKDIKDGRYSQALSNQMDQKMRGTCCLFCWRGVRAAPVPGLLRSCRRSHTFPGL